MYSHQNKAKNPVYEQQTWCRYEEETCHISMVLTEWKWYEQVFHNFLDARIEMDDLGH